ncbi:MAG TPA: YggT family protein [Nocardioidaceae bacterium]|nr:YggT family protein [Actinomycetota bacterium]MDQ3422747.1 YggT family protein [Actinomycetota bacterium]HEV8054853.1 YggT family protein [Nocardioidaceae bacterium]
MYAFGSVLELVLWLFLAILFVRFVVDWVQIFARSWSPRGPLLVLLEGVYTVTDPPLRALRRVIPPLRFGGIGLDLSFMVLMLITYLLLNITRAVFST